MRAFVLLVCLAACRDDARTISPLAGEHKPLAPPSSTAVLEAPMVTVAPSSRTILAPPTVAAPPLDAPATASGLRSKILVPGAGERPSPDDKVLVHYTGWTTDGKTIDSSVLRGEPATFPLKAVIKGWTEGLQQMRVGEQRRLWIPAALAYGDVPSAGKPTGMLVFDVQLIAIPK